MSYGQLAVVYDRLMEDAPYDEWKAFFLNILSKEEVRAEYVLELGCGTGEITHRLEEEGFKMTGVDMSEEMLAIASSKRNSSIRWVQQDIANLEGLREYGAVISFCDVVNYITEERGLESMFLNAYEALEEGGVFIFDIHSPSHAHKHMSGQTFAEVYDDLSYIWFCDEENDVMTHDLTFFIEHEGVYRRFDEVHHQRIYQPDYIRKALSDAGFEISGVYSDFSLDESEDGDRIFFVCKKV
ncbi:class I SAM-dependent DNA methyltransferase [Salimicrobium salexigens]|uniref:Methyltransferase domain-containing protein n=1 Tax=Salimicrobium salexigens TaxID=908941 RepID=A0ABY1KS07_9BACI|nr:class I SAM-dependent methyltransferase [Salimicrobium salexigens]SIS52107.1 Methyltransferase domain-containing protein [Salimicrobium salexigens]